MTNTTTYRGITFGSDSYHDNYDNVYEPTVKQVKNIIDMVAAIRFSPPPHFDMNTFMGLRDEDMFETLVQSTGTLLTDVSDNFDVDPFHMKKLGSTYSVAAHTCGTSGCAIGTAAYHGIGKITKDMTWTEYSEEVFGIDESHEIWDYVFGYNWSSVDNTATGAAARLLHLVIRGATGVREDVLQLAEKFKNNGSFKDWPASNRRISAILLTVDSPVRSNPKYLKSLYSKYLNVVVGEK